MKGNPYTKYLIGGLIVCLAIVFFISKPFFGGTLRSSDKLSILIGTASAPLTLKPTYTGAGSVSSTANYTYGLDRHNVGVKYTPKSYGSYVYINIERSLDPSCTTYFPFSSYITSGSTSNTLFYAGASSTDGMPYVLGSDSSASGTVQYASFNLEGSSSCVKFSAKENTTSTAGTIYIYDLLTN
jgi:hypothetical protein